MKILKVAFIAGVLGVCGMAFGADTKIGVKECYLPMLSCDNDEGGSECKKQQSVYDDFTKALDSVINPLTYTSYDINDEATGTTKGNNRELTDHVIYGLTFHGGLLRDAIKCKGQNCTKKAYNDDGKLQYEANCTNGVNNGPQRFYDWNGKLELEINYSNGKPSGAIKTIDGVHETIAEIKNGKLNGKIQGNMFRGSESADTETFAAEFKNGNLVVLNQELCSDATCWYSEVKITNYNADGTFNGEIIGNYASSWIKNSKEYKFKIPYELTTEYDDAGMESTEVKTWLEGGFNDKGEKHGEWKYTDIEWDENKGEMIEKIKRHEVYENGVRTKILR